MELSWFDQLVQLVKCREDLTLGLWNAKVHAALLYTKTASTEEISVQYV